MKYIREKNLKKLKENHIYHENMEHDACGVGLVVSTEGKKSRKVVESGIEALKAVWHRGAIDADGKTGDGAGIHIEIPTDFFVEKIEVTGHSHDNSELCVGMIFLPRNDYSAQEACRTIVESELTKNNFNIYGWRQVPVNPSVLGEKAEQTRPEITQILFKYNDRKLKDKELNRLLYETRRVIEKKALSQSLFYKNLQRIGYRYLNTKFKKKIIKSFQRRYRQNKVDGILDSETFEISEILSKKSNIQVSVLY